MDASNYLFISKSRWLTSPVFVCRSYFSSEGCSGEPAQYDIFITEDCIVYDEPLGAYGTFQCNMTGMEYKLCDKFTISRADSFHIVFCSGHDGADVVRHPRW